MIYLLFNKLREYVSPNDLEIHIYKNGIYVVNYKLISSFNDNRIVIEVDNNKLYINGNKLIISRLKKDELFISGNIDSINFNE